MAEVIRFLEKVDPQAAARARYRYSCFDAFGENTQAYGYAAEFGLTTSCEDQAVQQSWPCVTASFPRTRSSTRR
jgi:erythromycin esterase-like protein